MTDVQTSVAGAEARPFRVEVREEDLGDLRRRTEVRAAFKSLR